MNSSSLRSVIVLLTIATAAIHAYLNVMLGSLDVVFTLNAVGYLAFLFALSSPLFATRRNWVLIAFMGYTLVTILAWVAMGDKSLSPLGIMGWIDKAIEVLLLGALWLYRKAIAV
jgi:hypothetical protein